MAGNEEEEFKIRYIVLTAIALIGLGASLYASSKPHVNVAPRKVAAPVISDVTVLSSANRKVLNVSFPSYRDGLNGEMLDFNFKVAYAAGQPALFHITPDDCLEKLEVNGKEIGLTAEANTKRCDWQGGFSMDLQPYLHEGSNNVHILVRNISGWVGLNVQPAN